MKIDRLLGILIILLNKRKVTASYLSDHFEVSVRTIQRDMDTLTLAGIPLYADVGSGGGYSLMEAYKIEKGFLNRSEASILMSFLKDLEKISPTPEIKSMSNKFLQLSQKDLDTSKISIHLNLGLDSKLFSQHMNYIAKAREQLKKLKITYLNIDYQETTRIVCPHTLVLYTSNWYLYGYCQLRHGFRMFKLNRIAACEILDENYELKPLPSPLPWESQLESRTNTRKIILEIDKILQGKLPDYFSPSLCEIKEDMILVTLNYPVDEWVYSLLMSLVPYVRIREPQDIKQEFIKRLKQCIQKNNYDIYVA